MSLLTVFEKVLLEHVDVLVIVRLVADFTGAYEPHTFAVYTWSIFIMPELEDVYGWDNLFVGPRRPQCGYLLDLP